MKCSECRGACCESFQIEIPFSPNDPDSKRWIKLHGVEHGNKISFEAKCLELTSDGKCGIWEDRPMICELFIAGGPHCLATVKSRRTPADYERIREEGDPDAIHEC